MHSALVAHQSKPLTTLVHGPMKEATDRCAIWKDVDEATFERFSEFAYTGNYMGAEPQKRAQELVHSTVDAPIEPRYHSPLYSPVGNKKEQLWTEFRSLYPSPRIQAPSFQNFPEDDCTEVFLSHARMYVFADYHGIDELRILALRKLRQTLMRFILYEEACYDIPPLVEYSFDNTVEEGENVDALRNLLRHYAACVVETLWENPDFQNLIESVPDFSKGFITVMIRRLE